MAEILVMEEGFGSQHREFGTEKIRKRNSERFDLKMFRLIIQGRPNYFLKIFFRVTPGEKLVIMGATGSGKSTLLNLIPRFYEPT